MMTARSKVRDEAVNELLNAIIVRIHERQEQKLVPTHGYFATVGGIVLYLRRDSGEQHRLSYWPRSASRWEAIFRMDSLGLIRDAKPNVQDIRIDSTDTMDIRIDRSERDFHRDLVFIKMVMSGDD